MTSVNVPLDCLGDTLKKLWKDRNLQLELIWLSAEMYPLILLLQYLLKMIIYLLIFMMRFVLAHVNLHDLRENMLKAVK